MTTLTEILEVNWVILYFVYGQVFFVMGLVTGLQWRRGSQLEIARPLPWLAAFGIAHGLNEWGYIFVPLQALLVPDSIVRVLVLAHVLLLALSFFFLLQFGVELLLPARPRWRWLRGAPLLMLLAWGTAVLLRIIFYEDPLNVLIAIGDGWSRYLLAFPGAMLAHLGLIRQGRQVRKMGLPRIARYLTGAAVAFSVYALVGGLIVPTAPTFPADLINYALLDRTVHIPAPVFRSLCGLAMAVTVARFLQVFQVETDRRIEDMERAQLLSADRERIGRELHDGIIQNIYASGLRLEETSHLVAEDPGRAREQIGAVMQSLNRTIYDIRNYIFELRAQEQASELEGILRGLVQDLRLDTLLDVDLEVVGQRCCTLRPERISHFTQIAREALSNVVQHAGANHVSVRLAYERDRTLLTVTDDGRGFAGNPHRWDRSPGQGIKNMQTRAKMIGGDLALENRPGHGLRLVLTVPCADEKPVETEV